MTTDPPRPKRARHRKRRRSWDAFLQLLLFAVVAVVLKQHFGVEVPWP